MEYCEFGKECGKFGLGRCAKAPTPIKKSSGGFGPVNASHVSAIKEAGKGSFNM